jgi:hypothetical protein
MEVTSTFKSWQVSIFNIPRAGEILHPVSVKYSRPRVPQGLGQETKNYGHS